MTLKEFDCIRSHLPDTIQVEIVDKTQTEPAIDEVWAVSLLIGLI